MLHLHAIGRLACFLGNPPAASIHAKDKPNKTKSSLFPKFEKRIETPFD
jgi:hypothetical protein